MFNPADYSQCPVTGEPITRITRIEASEYGGTKGYSALFLLIGKSAIHTSVYGFSNVVDTKRYMQVVDNILSSYFPDNEPFALIEDYHWHEGASLQAKMTYIKYVKSLKGLRKYAFYSVQPFFKVLISLAKRLNPRNQFTVNIYDNYTEAIKAVYARTNTQPQNGFVKIMSGIESSEWQNMPLTPSYSASFTLVDKNIFLSAPFGDAGHEGIPAFMKVRKSFLESAGIWNSPHVEIKDYSLIKHHPGRTARNQFTDAMIEERNRGFLKGVVGVNASYFIQWVHRVGMRIYGGSFKFPIAVSMPNAVDKARKILAAAGVEMANIPHKTALPVWEKPEWKIERENFRFDCSVLAADIVRIQVSGKPLLHDLDPVVTIIENSIKSIKTLFTSHYRIFDFRLLDVPDVSFLRKYTALFRKINSRHPSNCTVFFGLSPAAVALTKFYSPFSSSHITIAKDEDEALSIISRHRNTETPVLSLPIDTKDDWNHITPDFSMEQAIYGNDILLQQITGKPSEYDLDGIERAHFLALSEIESRGKLPHFRIYDLSGMKVPSRATRKKYIVLLRRLNSRFSARLVVLCGMGSILSFLARYNNRRFGVRVAVAPSIAAAFARIELYRKNDLEFLHGTVSEKLFGNIVRSNPEWEYKSINYMIRVSLLGNDIVYVHEIGTLEGKDIEMAVQCRLKAARTLGKDSPAHYRIENLKERNIASIDINRQYATAVAAIDRETDTLICVVFGLSPVMSVVSRMLSSISSIPVFQTKDAFSAFKLIERNRGSALHKEKRKESILDDTDEIQNLLNFIASINWENSGLEGSGYVVPHSHPLRPIYESISLIKQDFDTVITDKENAEKKLAEENRLNGLRAEIWKIASNNIAEPKDLAVNFVQLLRLPLGACRCAYMSLEYDDNGNAIFICLAEDRDDTMPQLLGNSIPARLILPLLQSDAVSVTESSLSDVMKEAEIEELQEDLVSFKSLLNTEAALLMPHREENGIAGYFTIEYCAAHKELCPNRELAVLVNREFHVLLLSVAARKKAEQAIQNAYSELEDRVRSRTTELSDSNRRLEEARKTAVMANEAKSRFLSNMSHEIRTPLNAIIGFSQIIIESTSSENNKLYGERIFSESKRLLELINQFLDISKIEAGKMKTELVSFSLQSLVGELQNSFGLLAHSKGLYFSISIDDTIPQLIQGDEVKLRQILVNLIGNAVKFTDSGNVRIMLRRLQASEADIIVRFEVTDTGQGIPPESLETIFLPFEQTNTQSAKKYGGSGLGTTIASHLVKLLGGKIGVSSVLGKGSTFWFELPFIAAAETFGNNHSFSSSTKAPKPEISRKKRLAGKKILLVEDYLPNQEIAMHMLCKTGAAVDLCEDGKAALAAVKNTEYDIVLMDVQMPVMDGLTATSEIRKMGKYQKIPIIGMTAYAFDEERTRCFTAGMDDVITKPIDWEKALDSISGRISASGAETSSFATGQIATHFPVISCAVSGNYFDGAAYLKRMHGNKEISDKILAGFLSILPTDIDKLKNSITTGNIKTAERIIHSIKGAALNLCATKLAEISLEIEQKLKSSDFVENNKLAEFDMVVKNFVAEAEKFVSATNQ